MKNNNDNYQFQIVIIIIAFLIRLLVILVGSYIDEAWSPLHFTDIDYWVFNDAAGHVAVGQSAYERPSYRYSPILAWMLLGVLCGEEYWEHAVFHHFHRIDHRHNFSVYSYLLYLLKSSGGTLPGYFSIIAFGLQALVLLGVALKWARSNLILCLLLQTLVFVAFNKVATAQYFLWYLALLPLALRRDQLVKPYLLVAGGLWMASVGWWLRLGYEVEFQGQPAMRALWFAALFLLFAHVLLIMAIAKAAVE
eukprot:gene8067-8897_t